MAVWNPPTDTEIDVDKPIKAVDIRRIRDLPEAMAARAAGAPSISPERYESTAALASDATADFTLLADADEHVFRLRGVIPATDNTYFYIKFSDDAGATFETVNAIYSISGATGVSLTGTANMRLGLNIGSAASEYGVSGEVVISQISGDNPIFRIQTTYLDNAGSAQIFTAGGQIGTTADVNFVQFVFSVGNLETGEIYHSSRIYQ